MENRHVVKEQENKDKENNIKNTEAEQIDERSNLSASRDRLFSGSALRTSGLCHLRRNIGVPHLPKVVRSC